MIAFIVDSKNSIGHPTRKCKMIRKLLKQGKAKVLKGGLKSKQPILVQLLTKVFDKSKTIDCEFRIGIDPGYQNIGYCVFKIYNNKIIKLFSGEVILRIAAIKDNLDTRRMYRRNRRHLHRKNIKRKFGNAKFKHPIWKNRKKHKLQPMHKFLINSHINVLQKILKLIPFDQMKIHIEHNKFDIHKIIKPNIYKWQYQKGDQYGFENIKAYVRNRDNYQCQICKKQVGKLPNEVHHIVWKSKGGSDRPLNLILLCPECHTKVHSYKITCPVKSTSVNKYRDAGILNSCMTYVWQVFENSNIPIQDTYGYITNYVRKAIGLEKTHANDASVIAFCDSLGVQDFSKYSYINSDVNLTGIQHRRHNRSFTQRYEDRKYYIEGYKEAFAWNRNRRDGQDKKKICLTELKQYLINNNALSKVQIIAKPGRKVYRRSNRDILFRPGDIIKCSKGVDVVKGWASTQGKVITEHLDKIKQVDCKKILNNCGMVFI